MPTDAGEWAETFAREFQSTDDLGAQLLQLAIIVAAIWLLRWLILRLILQRTHDSSTTYWVTKISSYVASALSLAVASQIWLGQSGSLLTFFGLITAGLAIALRDPVTNMFAWLFIVWRRPFELGDRIQIGESVGDVIDIRIFQTSLLEIGNWVAADQPSGRIIHIPNSVVFNQMQFNYSLGIPFIWDEIPVLVTFESDWQKAKRILINIVEHAVPIHDRPSPEDLRRMSRTFRLSTLNTQPAVYTSVLDSGVLLTMRYTVPPSQRRGLAERIWESVLRDFADHPDIDFAYPTTRFYNNRLEGPMANLDRTE
ncbi:MAG: mechanosensitive ion channel family protein [Thermomicrobiales bacterium]